MTILEQIEEVGGIEECLKQMDETNRKWREALEKDKDWQHMKKNTMPYCNKKGDSDDLQ